MGKKIFATPEEEAEYKKKISAYNKAYKERPEYKAYIKTFKASEDYKERQREYQKDRYRTDEFQEFRKTKTFKKRQKKYQKKFYKKPENKLARRLWEKDYIDRPGVRDNKNTSRRDRRRLIPEVAERERKLQRNRYQLGKMGFGRKIIDRAVQTIKLKRFCRKQRIKSEINFLLNKKKIYSKVGYMIRTNVAVRTYKQLQYEGMAVAA